MKVYNFETFPGTAGELSPKDTTSGLRKNHWLFQSCYSYNVVVYISGAVVSSELVLNLDSQ